MERERNEAVSLWGPELSTHASSVARCICNQCRNFQEHLLTHKSIRSKERNALMKLYRGYRNEKKTNESEYLQIVGDSILYGQVR